MFTAEDAEVVKKTLARIDEQDKWNDVFSTKLIELLDNIDGIKGEIRERARRVEQNLTTAQDRLMAACELAEAAERKRIDAAMYFQNVVKWTVCASALSWIAVAWIVWFTFRLVLPVWTPCVATAVFVLAGILVIRRSSCEA